MSLDKTQIMLIGTHPGFSLNFSSAGKGPFMDGKAKNIDKTFLGSGGWGGGWAGGVRYMDPAVTGKFFYSHILKHILRKSAVVRMSTSRRC